MSHENVEIVRRAYAAFSEGNLGPVLEAFDPDIEWTASDIEGPVQERRLGQLPRLQEPRGLRELRRHTRQEPPRRLSWRS